MYSKFSFNLEMEGSPGQHIVFRPEGGDVVNVAVPDVVFPAELEPRFRQMYQILVEKGLIPDNQPVFNA